MIEPKIDISQDETTVYIKCFGRLNFQYTNDFRTYVKSLNIGKVHDIIIDMKNCIGMDSTFMGVLSMLGLKAYKVKIPTTMHFVSDSNMFLLKGLGLTKIFKFSDEEYSIKSENSETLGLETDKMKNAETVIDAHETLMDIDSDNVQKFEGVVNYTKEDLKNMKEEEGR